MGTKGYIYCLLLMAVALICGCSEDELPGGGDSRGSATVTIQGRTGAAPTGAGLGIDESAIEEIDLLVFHDGYFHQRSVGYGLSEINGDYTCSFNIDTYDGRVDLFFIANARADILASQPVNTQDIETVRSKLTVKYSRQSLDMTTMPMSVTKSYPAGVDDDFTIAGIELYRIGAKVEVILDESQKSIFKLDMVQVYRANDLAQLVPDEGAIQYVQQKGAYVAVAPSVPAAAKSRINTYQVACDSDSKMTEVIYIPESKGGGPTNEITCIVLRGSYQGGPPTYYHLDFTSKGNIGEVLRNSHYKITIDEVNGDGTDEPDERPSIDPIEFSVEVLDWTEEELGAESDYMAVSAHEIPLHFYETATGIVTVSTNIPDYAIQWWDPVAGQVIAGSELITVGGEMRNGDFKVTVDDNGSKIRATALNDNDGDDYINGYIQVSSGNIKFVINLRQATRGMRDYVHIFNLTQTHGTLGDEVLQIDNPYDPFAMYGRGLKQILKNTDNFGMHGTVPFDGFYISGLPFKSPLSPYLLEIFDVIYIPTIRSDAINKIESAYLFDWVQKPNKALVIQTDIGSNPQLLSYLGIVTQPFSISFHMQYKISEEAPDVILNGPFGKIDGTIPISMPGQASMIDRNDHPWLTPIVTRADAGMENYMIIALDEKNSILYCGDYRLYINKADHDGVLTGNGRVENSYDIMLANIWAWVAESILDDSHDKDIRL